MKVEHITGSKYTVKADSRSHYIVDLEANNRRGSCNCKHFKCRIQPKWNKRIKAEPCKHIIFAWGHLAYNKVNK